MQATSALSIVGHGRARRGHPRLSCNPEQGTKTWMPALSAGMTVERSPNLENALLPARALSREGDDLADRGQPGKDHHQPVDADPEAAGRRHAVFQRLEEIGVEHALGLALGLRGLHLRL